MFAFVITGEFLEERGHVVRFVKARPHLGQHLHVLHHQFLHADRHSALNKTLTSCLCSGIILGIKEINPSHAKLNSSHSRVKSESMSSTFSSATCDEMCHIRLSLRNFIPYGPNSSDRDRISVKQRTQIITTSPIQHMIRQTPLDYL